MSEPAQPNPEPQSRAVEPVDAKHEHDFVNALEQYIPPTRTVGDHWYSYTDGAWREVSVDRYRPIALALQPLTKRKERNAQIYLRHLESRLQFDGKLFRGAIAFHPSEGVLVNARNGVLHVTPDSIKLIEHAPGYNFTRSMGVVYDPDARCPLYMEAQERILPDDGDRDLKQLCFGNFLYPDCRFEVALIEYGEAGTGKSTMADPIAEIFGTSDDGLLTRLSMSQICDPKCYSLAKLNYACVNVGTELQSIEVEESANFKTIVSGEPLEARPIYAHPFTMKTHCKFWFLANKLPRFKNGTEAEQRRCRFIHYSNKPEVIDVTLKSRLPLEKQGIFNYGLVGLQRLQTAKGIHLGGSHSKAVHARFRVSNDPLGTFIKDNCRMDPNVRIDKDELVRAYESYLEDFGFPKEFAKTFHKQLYERFPDVKAQRARTDGTRSNFVVGVTLRPEAVKHALPDAGQPLLSEGLDLSGVTTS